MAHTLRFGIVVFPGSNCDHDAYHAAKHVFGQEAVFVWHQDRLPSDIDVVILPGGFSYGDYLRAGAIARFSPVMQDIIRFAQQGKPVIGICNGFQILCESGLLPGALTRNASLRFICKPVHLRVERNDTLFTNQLSIGDVLQIPIAHGEGNYLIDPEGLAALEANRQVVFRYAHADGTVSPDANPNGSLNNIAGIVNQQGNVLGMMPHPERCVEPLVGGTDGQAIFRSLIHALTQEVLSA